MIGNIDQIEYRKSSIQVKSNVRYNGRLSAVESDEDEKNYQDVHEIIGEKLNTLSPEVKRVLLLGFCSLVLVFKETNLKESKKILEKTGNGSERSLLSIETVDGLNYSRIPSIPYGAARMLWCELLNVHRDNTPLPALNVGKGITSKTLASPLGSISLMQSWGNYITSAERECFLDAARSHSLSSIEKDQKPAEHKSSFGSFFQNLMTNYEDTPEDTTKLCLADAVVDFMRDTLVQTGLVRIAHVSPRSFSAIGANRAADDDDLYINDECSEGGTSDITDWIYDHPTQSRSIGSINTTYTTSILLNEEKRKRKIINRVMKEQNLSYLIIKSGHHYQYGLNLFEIPISKGGFLCHSFARTSSSFNEIMVAACLRQRKRVELANSKKPTSARHLSSSNTSSRRQLSLCLDEERQNEMIQHDRQILEVMLDDASLYGIRLLPSHLMRAKKIPEVISLLQDPSFLTDRLKILMVTEGVSRTKRDQKELQLRKYKRSEYKTAMVECFMVMKDCLMEIHPIAVGSDRRPGVVNEGQVGDVGEAFDRLADALNKNGWMAEAIDFYNIALKFKSTSFGPNDISLSKTLHKLGHIYALSKDYSKAAKAYQHTLKVETYSLGRESYTTAETYKKIASSYSMLGDYKKSVSFYEDALLAQMKLVGEKNDTVAELYSSIGVVHALNKNYNKALFCYKEALQLLSSPTSPLDKESSIASIHHNIGLLYFKLENFSDAMYHYRQALTIEENPETGSAILHSMGVACTKEKELNDAVGCFQQSVHIKKKSKANEKDLLRTLLPLANALSDLERYDEALSCYEEGKHIFYVLFGETQKYASILRNIALIYARKANISKATSTYDMALDISKKELGPEHIDISEILYEKANVLFESNDENDKNEAVELYDKGVQMKARLLGNDYIDVVVTKNNLGVMSLKMHRYRKALSYFYEVLQVKQEIIGDGDQKIADTLQNVGLAHKSLKEYDLALEHYEKAYDIRKSKLDKNDPKIFDALYNIAIVLSNQRNYKLALEKIQEALRGYEVCGYDDSHPNSKNAKQWIKFMNRKMKSKKMNSRNVV